MRKLRSGFEERACPKTRSPPIRADDGGMRGSCISVCIPCIVIALMEKAFLASTVVNFY